MNALEIIMAEKKRFLYEMSEYNKRLDRTIVLYLSSLYTAIGLKMTGQITIQTLYDDPGMSLVAYLFVFLNFCIILHGISQSAWSMAIAKFVHVYVNNEIINLSHDLEKRNPIIINEWDDWKGEIKGLAIETRTLVMAIWILIVLSVSMYSISIVHIKAYFLSNMLITILIVSFLFLFLTYIIFSGLREIFFTTYYHKNSWDIKVPTAKLIILSVLSSIFVYIICINFVIK